MARVETLDTAKREPVPADMSLKDLRQRLNELRRQARQLDEPAVEECLTLAISLTSQRRAAN